MADGLSERGDKSVETVSSKKQEKGKKSEQSLGGPWGAVDRNSISTELRKEGRERAGKKKNVVEEKTAEQFLNLKKKKQSSIHPGSLVNVTTPRSSTQSSST